jgi:hypothetical protein
MGAPFAAHWQAPPARHYRLAAVLLVGIHPGRSAARVYAVLRLKQADQ